MSSPEILPDSRQHTDHTPKGMIQGPWGMWVPVFCGNCGIEGGSCPEQNMTFIFWLCQKCAETYGEIAGTMLMPDEVFFEKLKQEQMASFGHYLTQQELAIVVEEDASPLATLLISGR